MSLLFEYTAMIWYRRPGADGSWSIDEQSVNLRAADLDDAQAQAEQIGEAHCDGRSEWTYFIWRLYPHII